MDEYVLFILHRVNKLLRMLFAWVYVLPLAAMCLLALSFAFSSLLRGYSETKLKPFVSLR
jgi:hypothetical protein